MAVPTADDKGIAAVIRNLKLLDRIDRSMDAVAPVEVSAKATVGRDVSSVPPWKR